MNKYNSEGYPDPTAYYGTKEIVREESEQERRIRHLMHIVREAAHLAGFEGQENRKGIQMKLGYTVSKEKGGQWYCHQVGFPYVPVFESFGDKKKALHVAAEMCGLPYKEYMQLRQKGGCER